MREGEHQRGLEYMILVSNLTGFLARVYSKLAINASYLCLDRVEGNHQFASDLWIGAPLGQQA
jgi:hypothetical protein